MTPSRSRSLASLRICVLQLPALLRRSAEPPAGADPAAVAAWVLEKKQLQMRRIEEALCRTLELLKKRSPAEEAAPLSHTFHDDLVDHSASVPSAAVPSPDGSSAFAAASPQRRTGAAPPRIAAHTAAAARATGCLNVGACLERLPAASTSAAAATPFDLLVLPEMWSSPYHSSCFSKYAEELPACVESTDICPGASPRSDPTADAQQLAQRTNCSSNSTHAADTATADQLHEQRTSPRSRPPASGEFDRTQDPSAATTSARATDCIQNGTTVGAAADDRTDAAEDSAAAAGEVARETASPAFAFMQALARRLRVFVVGGSLVEKHRLQQEQEAQGPQQQAAATGGKDSPAVSKNTAHGSRLYNTCCVFDRAGRFISKYRKSHLFDVNILKEEDPAGRGLVFQESAVLSAGEALGSFSLPPFGNVGIGICYDLRFPEYALALAQQRQCTLLCYPGAFNQTTGPSHWSLLLRGRALDNQVYVVGCSPASPAATAAAAAETAPGAGIAGATAAERGTVVPCSESRVTPAGQSSLIGEYPCYGHSMVVGPWGDVAAQLKGEPGVIVVTATAQRVRLVRQQIPIYKQKRFNQLYSQVSEVSPPPAA